MCGDVTAAWQGCKSRATTDNMAFNKIMGKVVHGYGYSISDLLTYVDVESESLAARSGDGASHILSRT